MPRTVVRAKKGNLKIGRRRSHEGGSPYHQAPGGLWECPGCGRQTYDRECRCGSNQVTAYRRNGKHLIHVPKGAREGWKLVT